MPDVQRGVCEIRPPLWLRQRVEISQPPFRVLLLYGRRQGQEVSGADTHLLSPGTEDAGIRISANSREFPHQPHLQALGSVAKLEKPRPKAVVRKHSTKVAPHALDRLLLEGEFGMLLYEKPSTFESLEV